MNYWGRLYFNIETSELYLPFIKWQLKEKIEKESLGFLKEHGVNCRIRKKGDMGGGGVEDIIGLLSFKTIIPFIKILVPYIGRKIHDIYDNILTKANNKEQYYIEFLYEPNEYIWEMKDINEALIYLTKISFFLHENIKSKYKFINLGIRFGVFIKESNTSVSIKLSPIDINSRNQKRISNYLLKFNILRSSSSNISLGNLLLYREYFAPGKQSGNGEKLYFFLSANTLVERFKYIFRKT